MMPSDDLTVTARAPGISLAVVVVVVACCLALAGILLSRTRHNNHQARLRVNIMLMYIKNKKMVIMIRSSGLLLLGVLGPAAGAEQLVHPPAHRHPHLCQGEHQVCSIGGAFQGHQLLSTIEFDLILFNSRKLS